MDDMLDLTLSIEDLSENPWLNKEAVSISINEFSSQLKAAKVYLDRNDSKSFIQKYAKMLIGYIRHKGTNDPRWFTPSVKLLVDCVIKHKDGVEDINQSCDSTTIDALEAFELRNSLRVAVFILCRLIFARQRLQQVDKGADPMAYLMARRENNKNQDKGQLILSSLQALNGALDEKTQDLWYKDPVDSEFLRILMSPFFHEFERHTFGKSKVFHDLFVSLVVKLATSTDFAEEVCMRMAESMKFEECCSLTVAECIKQVQPSVKSFLDTFLLECLSRCKEDLAKKTSAAFFKNFQVFIDEVAQSLPRDLVRSMPLLIKLIKHDNYVARISVISAMSVVFENCTSKHRSDPRILEMDNSLLATFLICKRLATAKVIPVRNQLQFVMAAIKRVKDHSSLVRRHALGTVLAFATSNDFTTEFDVTAWKERLNEKMKSCTAEGEVENAVSVEDPSQLGEDLDAPIPRLPEGGEADESTHDTAYVIKYLKATVRFVTMVASTVPWTVIMLRSKLQSDVTCALDFLVKCFCDLNIESARTTVDGNLHLIWHPEKVVRDALINAFVQIHLDPGVPNGDRSVQKFMSSLQFIDKCGFFSVEVILNELYQRELLNDGISNRILDIIGEETTAGECKRNAFVLLNLLNRQRYGWIKTNIDRIVDYGLSGQADLRLMGECYRLIVNVRHYKIDPTSHTAPLTDSMFTHGIDTSIDTLKHAKLDDWKFLVDQLLVAISYLASDPTDLLESMAARILRTFEDDEDDATGMTNVSVDQLSKFCFFLGCFASSLMRYSEGRYIEQLRAQELDHTSDDNEGTEKDSLFTSHIGGCDNYGQFHDDTNELKLEAQQMLNENAFCEGSILRSGCNFIKTLVSSHTDNLPEASRKIFLFDAHVALLRIAMISAERLEEHLGQVFAILEDDEADSKLKSTLIMILGDLAMRYPNTMEPWNHRIYKLIRSKSVRVRATALRTIARLVLREMIKVRGQISEVAVCVVDCNKEIRSLSRYFFEQLGSRTAGASIYNVFPDILSRLSDIEHGVSHEKVKNVLSYLLKFITKDKHRENLVIRLCQRMRLCSEPKQWADIACCLSLVVQSDRTMKKLSELFPSYGDKIHDDMVYKYFRQLIQAKRRAAKQINRAIVEEFDQQVEAVRLHGLEGADENFINKPLFHGDRTTRKRPNKSMTGRMSKADRIPRQHKRKVAKRIAVDSSSSRSSSDEFSPGSGGKGVSQRRVRDATLMRTSKLAASNVGAYHDVTMTDDEHSDNGP